MSGAFETGAHTEVRIQVTHPPGTTFDADGKPIPPSSDTEQSEPEEDQS